MRTFTPSTFALLQAVAGPQPSVLQQFQKWQAETDIDHLEDGQYLLLPLLYHRLNPAQDQHPWMPRIKGVYRRMWYGNQVALKSAGKVIEILDEAACPALLIGSAVLSLTVYDDPATRPVGAPQILVAAGDRLAAIQTLINGGWRSSSPLSMLQSPDYGRWQSGHLFRKEDEHDVKLCWHALPPSPSSALTDAWMARAIPFATSSFTANSLDPTDHLLHALAASPGAELIFLIDGIKLIQRYPIDWSRLVQMAKENNLAADLAGRLAEIQQLGVIELPGQHLNALKQANRSENRSRELSIEKLPSGIRTRSQRFQLVYNDFRQKAAAQGLSNHPLHFYDYLRVRFATNSFISTVRAGIKRILRPVQNLHDPRRNTKFH